MRTKRRTLLLNGEKDMSKQESLVPFLRCIAPSMPLPRHIEFVRFCCVCAVCTSAATCARTGHLALAAQSFHISLRACDVLNEDDSRAQYTM